LSKVENILLENLIQKKWTISILNEMQFLKADKKISEMWIDQYIDTIVEELKDHKIFVVGYSSGAYILGMYLQHTQSKNAKIQGYGILSFSVDVDNENNKTVFTSQHFQKPTLFISGDIGKDTKENPPFADGLKNTEHLYNIAKQTNTTDHKFIKIEDIGHAIFDKLSQENKSQVAEEIDKKFNEIIQNLSDTKYLQ
jgi:alpha-beta hydrolase superfamily lysophospholipase